MECVNHLEGCLCHRFFKVAASGADSTTNSQTAELAVVKFNKAGTFVKFGDSGFKISGECFFAWNFFEASGDL